MNKKIQIKNLLAIATNSINEAFQGVEVTGDMASKTGDNPLSIKQKKRHLFTSAFWLFQQRRNKFSSVIFFGTFSNYGIVQDRSLEREATILTKRHIYLP